MFDHRASLLAPADLLERKLQWPFFPRVSKKADELPQTLLQSADRLEPTVRQQFIELIAEVRNVTSLEALEAAAAQADIEAVVNAIPWDDMRDQFKGLLSTLDRGMQLSGQVSTTQLNQLL